MGYSLDEPVFANRYRFEPIGSDWDRGRSGFTYLVSDIKNNNRKGVIKRAETVSKQATAGLKNEANALRALKKLGLGVPEVYDEGQANYLSKNYEYIVIEYIEGLRVESEISALTNPERAEILTQFLGLLERAHSKGIVNGDVDIKHLFWNKDRHQLAVIDWGNSILNVDKTKKTEFSYDLARTAEIIYALVVGKTPPATGPIALPNDSKLISGLAPIPPIFREICEWAPRTPLSGAKAPYNASELFKVAEKWKKAIKQNKPYVPKRSLVSSPILWLLLLGGLLGLITAFLLTIPNSFFPTETATYNTASSTAPAPNVTKTSPISTSLSETITATEELTHPPTQTITPSPETIPAPKIYFTSLIFDRQTLIKPETSNCWSNTTNDQFGLQQLDGFSRRDDGNWRFGVGKDRNIISRFQTDFSKCPTNGKINAIGVNIFVPQIEEGRELGFFIEDINGNRREYTIRIKRDGSVNQVDKMYLRIRDGDEINDFELLTTANLRSNNVFPRLYYQFSMLFFLEINNDGSDIFYFQERTPQKPLETGESIDPNQMFRADNAIRPTLDEVETFGLVGYGGEIQSVLWPLIFLQSK